MKRRHLKIWHGWGLIGMKEMIAVVLSGHIAKVIDRIDIGKFGGS
jgi:hypothetical protein